jgi:hypothetical protein
MVWLCIFSTSNALHGNKDENLMKIQKVDLGLQFQWIMEYYGFYVNAAFGSVHILFKICNIIWFYLLGSYRISIAIIISL